MMMTMTMIVIYLLVLSVLRERESECRFLIYFTKIVTHVTLCVRLCRCVEFKSFVQSINIRVFYLY